MFHFEDSRYDENRPPKRALHPPLLECSGGRGGMFYYGILAPLTLHHPNATWGLGQRIHMRSHVVYTINRLAAQSSNSLCTRPPRQ
jgi:hypothetical protein